MGVPGGGPRAPRARRPWRPPPPPPHPLPRTARKSLKLRASPPGTPFAKGLGHAGRDAHVLAARARRPPIRVGVDSGRSPSFFPRVGLAEASVRESRVRVRAALQQLGIVLDRRAPRPGRRASPRQQSRPGAGSVATLVPEPGAAAVDFAEVGGQHGARRALEIAAAGGHNLIMMGPPGSGKTMLARRLPTSMPPMSYEEASPPPRASASCPASARSCRRRHSSGAQRPAPLGRG
ncbi:ATP-binding protein [Sorangium sp. So ce385]|uniref:ATP-binding protein n=1 Tax=Sorangium sp. So ce385 TaxID=3133308 RepID=UPI003F5AE89E